MALDYAVLSSGSIGNAYVFFDGVDSIVVDCGITAKQMETRLESANIKKETIRAIFITHLHPDHVKGIRVFTKNTNIPVYINSFSAKKIPTVLVRYNIPSTIQKYFNINEEININSAFRVYPFELHHDCIGTVGFKIESIRANKTIAVITDTGTYTDETVQTVSDVDALFLEANYDEYMLSNGPYSKDLQERVKGDRGHLSNEQAANFVEHLKDHDKRKLHLIHVSANNNNVEKIYEAFKNVNSSKYSSIIALERGEYYKGML